MSWPSNIHGPQMGGWVYAGDFDFILPHQGWKLHVTAAPSNAAVDVIGDIGERHGVLVKFLPSRRALDGQTGEQRGKWNTVYTGSTLQAFAIAAELQERLSARGCKRYRANKRPPYDLYVCKFVCARYGPYKGGDLINDKGQLVPDAWKTNTFRPPWINNPWVHFNAMTTPGNREAVNLGSKFPEYRQP